MTHVKIVLESSHAVKSKIERDIEGKIQVKAQQEVYLPRSPYYTRFPSFFEKNTAVYNTYHRSQHKKLPGGLKKKDYVFRGNQPEGQDLPGMYPKTGNFYNNFHFEIYRSAVTPQTKPAVTQKNQLWYDKLLEFQKDNAKTVVDGTIKSASLSINSDNQYPCVLFSIVQPAPIEKNQKIWTQFLSIFFIAIVNKLAMERGIHIETVRRSSFDGVRPSVAECGKSLRISLGLTPSSYHRAVVDTIQYLVRLFENTSVFQYPIEKSEAINKVLKNYNTKKKCDLKLEKTLWESLWANGDSCNRSFATQIFRNEHVVEYLIDDIMTAMGEKTIADIFHSLEDQKTCFANPLMGFFQSLKLDGSKITTNFKNKALKKFQWPRISQAHDPIFWKFVREYAQGIGAPAEELQHLCDSNSYAELYHYFESWFINFNFMPRNYPDVHDGGGSESEAEADISTGQKICSKKWVTATGMRAIQLSFVAAKYFLEQKKIAAEFILTNAAKMYYETDDAINHYAIPFTSNDLSVKEKTQKRLSFFDLNHCNANQDNDEVKIRLSRSSRICILDGTSSTTLEMGGIIANIWKKFPQLLVVLVVSSGLKNEQAMSDCNPYGVIRIFSSTQEDREVVYNCLKSYENAAHYQHPRLSHILRKNAKDEGFTPTNQAILQECKNHV